MPMKRLAALQKNFRGRSTSFCRLCVWVVLFATLFASTPAVAQSARESSHVKRTYMNSTANEPSKSPLAIHQPDGERKMNALTMAIRGGAGVLLFPVNLVRDYVKDHTVGSFTKKHMIMVAKGAVIVFITASFMAYLGLIGDHDHHIQDWVTEKEHKFVALIRKWGFHPRGFLRTHLQNMLNEFRTMPPRPKFASAVSVGTTLFPLVVQTVNWTVRIVLGSFLFAEVLALLGVLGKPGEGLEKWVEEGGSEPLLRNIKRGIDEGRKVLRQKLQVQEIVNNFLESLKKDDIYWLGFGVGAVASILIKEKYDSMKE